MLQLHELSDLLNVYQVISTLSPFGMFFYPAVCVQVDEEEDEEGDEEEEEDEEGDEEEDEDDDEEEDEEDEDDECKRGQCV